MHTFRISKFLLGFGSKTLSNSFKLNYLVCVWFFSVCFLSSHIVSAQAPAAPADLIVSTISNTTIKLNWTDNSNNETGFRVERSLSPDSGFESFAMLPANATLLTDANLSAGTMYHYRINAFNDSNESAYTSVASTATIDSETELPYYWNNVDVGNNLLPGSATFSNGIFETEGNGRMTDTQNSFHFVYQTLQGDGEIVAQLTFMREAHWDHQGVMIKETLEPASSYAMNELYRDERILIFKGLNNGEFFSLEDSSKNHNTAIWLKMQRTGNTFIASYSKDGEDWTETNRETIDMESNALIGLVSHASTDDKISDAIWRDVSVSQGSSTIAAPSNLQVEGSQTDEAILTWDDNADNETGFRIERAIKGDDFIFEDLAEVGPNVTSYQDDGLVLGDFYSYRVRAINDNLASFPSNEEEVEIQKIQYTTMLLQRLAGDHDRTSQNNVINVTTTPDTVNNFLRHPGMIGKQIDVTLEDPLSSLNGTISFKIIPNTHNQTVDFFQSESLTISQVQDKLSVSANGEQNIYDVFLDSITCNHIALRFNNGVMSPYVNGDWFDDVNVGTFNVNSFELNEYDGNLWEIRFVNSQISDEIIYEVSENCTNTVEPLEPFNGFEFRHCRVYTCLWLENESQLQEEKKRAYLVAQDMTYDKNTFDIGMYIQPDLDAWVEQNRNVPSVGFDYFKLNTIFTKNQGNTAYWLHENFHGYQVPLLKGGKWLAEASAEWAAWNYYEEPLDATGIAAFTLNPHMSIYETFPSDSEYYHEVNRFYHSSIMLAYITTYLADESIMGTLYNTPAVEQNAFLTLINLLEDKGYDFDQEFTEFAARTTVWDYPNSQMSDDYEAHERKGLNVGLPDYRLVATLPEEGTYGVFQPVPEAFLPGSYGWNSYKIESTTASTYTLKVKGSDENPAHLNFVGKVVKGTPGAYEYFDFPIGSEVSQGNGEAQIEVIADAGEELFLVVVATSRNSWSNDNVDFVYEYAIESSAHILPNDHIRTFVLAEQNRQAIIDHDNFTVSAEVVRGTDATKLTPAITLSDGASSSPANGVAQDFTNPVTYQVTASGSVNAKDWTVNVDVVPLRTATDFLTFELQDLVPFSTINKENHTVTVNLVSDVDLTSVTPLFTLSDGAISDPAVGETVDLSSPVTYVVTAENGITTQNWTVSAQNFSPFITTWETETSKGNISIGLDDNYDYDFEYVWKNASGTQVASGSLNSEDENTLNSTLSAAGVYTLEIIGEFPHFSNYSSENLKDVNQWGDIPWRTMSLSFASWEGSGFSATDLPDLSRVGSIFAMFRDAEFFNGDLSEWDVSSVTGMSEMFSGAKVFNGDISKWDVSNVSGMEKMFREANTFNADISRWDISSLLNMDQMFFSTRSFNRSLGDWDMTSTPTMSQALRNSGLSRLNYDRTLIGWASQSVREEIEFGADGLNFCAGEDARNFLINEKKWIITDSGVDCPENGESNILFFALDEQLSPAIIDYENYTIIIEAAAGSQVTALKPTLTLSKDATSVPTSGTEVDFTDPVTYTVTALDGTTTQDWVVTVFAAEILEIDTEAEKNEYLIYPNPVTNILKLESQKLVTAYLSELSGRRITSKQTGTNLNLNLLELKGGIYILIIEDGHKITTRKIIKQTD